MEAAHRRVHRLAGDGQHHARRLPLRERARPALYAPLFDSPQQPPNVARFTFLDPAAQQFFTDWEKAAKDLVAALRAQAGRNPYDRALSDLIGELSTRSEPFRTRDCRSPCQASVTTDCSSSSDTQVLGTSAAT